MILLKARSYLILCVLLVINVTSDLPVLRELLNDANSVLCAPGDAPEWAAALVSAGQNADWRERIAATARHDALQYTWRGRVKRIIENLN